MENNYLTRNFTTQILAGSSVQTVSESQESEIRLGISPKIRPQNCAREFIICIIDCMNNLLVPAIKVSLALSRLSLLDNQLESADPFTLWWELEAINLALTRDQYYAKPIDGHDNSIKIRFGF